MNVKNILWLHTRGNTLKPGVPMFNICTGDITQANFFFTYFRGWSTHSDVGRMENLVK